MMTLQFFIFQIMLYSIHIAKRNRSTPRIYHTWLQIWRFGMLQPPPQRLVGIFQDDDPLEPQAARWRPGPQGAVRAPGARKECIQTPETSPQCFVYTCVYVILIHICTNMLMVIFMHICNRLDILRAKTGMKDDLAK